MVFLPGPFKEPVEGEVQDFYDLTKVQLRLNRNNIIINLVINQIK